MTLTRKQQLFVDYYLQCFNATRSAKLAGYKDTNAKQQGWQLRREPEIAKAIEERLAEVHMSADEALKLLAEIARGDIGEFLKIDKNGFDLDFLTAKGKTKLIKKIKHKTTYGGQKFTEIELYSALDALDKVLRVHGKFKDIGTEDNPLSIIVKKIGIDSDKL